MFSGYIPVEGEGRELFYWLVEGDKGFHKSPLLLWTNGGPGCSGLIGFLTEQGPFRPTKRGRLEENKFAWTKAASMVFIEQPVGVGFSKGGKMESYNDAKAAKDNYRFIVNFFQRYPELRTNEFFISSESYGGHYMPTLAKEIVDRGGVPNFKGFLVGNPLTSGQLRDVGEFMTFHGHSLIPQVLFDQYHKENCIEKTYSEACLHLASEARAIVAGLDPYGLDFPTCNVRSEKVALLTKLGVMKRENAVASEEEKQAHLRGEAVENEVTSSVSRRALQYFPSKYQPCEESYSVSWLNRPDVKHALHVREGAPVWSACNNYINIVYNQTDVEASMIPYYEYLATKPLKIWVYSGDDDSVCPTWSEQQWIWKFSTSSRWNPWHFQGQVAGYQVHMKGFTFATVHGAGHMVPSTRPAEALELLKRFLRA
jgi:carboxypeptidase C (cathepsin A)